MYEKIHRWSDEEAVVQPEPTDVPEAPTDLYNLEVKELPEHKRWDDGSDDD
jgi:hypothetical protein